MDLDEQCRTGLRPPAQENADLAWLHDVMGFSWVDDESQFHFIVEAIEEGLQLLDQQQPKFKPLRIDFVGGEFGFRRRSIQNQKQTIGRALALGSEVSSVIDATAGLCQDACIVAALGAQVRAVENSPIVFALANDALRRACLDEAFRNEIGQRMSLEHGDSVQVLNGLSQESRPDAVYLDPMFPEDLKASALPKKEMQVFRRLLGADNQAHVLLDAAMQAALKRVVLKRPAKAPLIGKPNHSLAGKSSRFDIYIRAKS